MRTLLTLSPELAETEVIEYMPEYLRASHVAARDIGCYPSNGALRLHVHTECADMLIASDPDWIWRI